jgi:superfamily II DNA helicase RecQ
MRDLPPALTNLSTTGLLRHESEESVAAWLDAAIAAGLVAVSADEYRTLRLTPKGREVMRGEPPQLVRPNRLSLRLPYLREERVLMAYARMRDLDDEDEEEKWRGG